MKKIPEDIRELEEKIARQREKENRLRDMPERRVSASGLRRNFCRRFWSAARSVT